MFALTGPQRFAVLVGVLLVASGTAYVDGRHASDAKNAEAAEARAMHAADSSAKVGRALLHARIAQEATERAAALGATRQADRSTRASVAAAATVHALREQIDRDTSAVATRYRAAVDAADDSVKVAADAATAARDSLRVATFARDSLDRLLSSERATSANEIANLRTAHEQSQQSAGPTGFRAALAKLLPHVQLGAGAVYDGGFHAGPGVSIGWTIR